MPVAKTKDELDDISVEDISKKMKNELRLFRQIKPFLRKINADFEQEYIASGQVVNTEDYKAELIALLMFNYNKTANDFKFNIRESFEEQVSPEINALVNTTITKRLRSLSNLRSDLILQTTNILIAKELAKSISSLIEKDIEITNIAIAKETRKNLNEKVPGRATTISMSEVQTSAELTKDIEEEILQSNDVVLDGVALATVLNDFWITAGDERVRMAHAAANGQRRGLDGVFIVGGEALRFPGDPNGSAGNIINCRCNLVMGIF